MGNKTILICLEALGIGGVETSVYNQSLALKERGYDVVVLARNCVYTEKLQEKGITCIDFEFKLGNEIDKEKTKRIVEIIKKYNICQVHIHQFPCLLSAFTAALITNTPYLAFVHSRLTEAYDWYIANFSIYKKLFKFYFDNAYKIITLNYGSIEINTNYFNTDKEKYKVLKNSIAFNEYVSNTTVENTNNFMIISRIAPEKIVSIQNGIKLFIEYANRCENFQGKLAIYGDGPEESVGVIQKYIEKNNFNNYNIYFAGKTNEVAKEMEKFDVVVGMGRCMIEAMAMRRIAILTSPEELKFLINDTNIYNAIEGNFASNDLQKEEMENIIIQLSRLNSKKIKEITTENYNIIFRELNMFTNVYHIEDLPIENNYEIKLVELMNIQFEDIKNQRDEITKQLKAQNDRILDLENRLVNQEKQNRELSNELNAVYNSKRFKIANKIANMLTKNNKKT